MFTRPRIPRPAVRGRCPAWCVRPSPPGHRPRRASACRAVRRQKCAQPVNKRPGAGQRRLAPLRFRDGRDALRHEGDRRVGGGDGICAPGRGDAPGRPFHQTARAAAAGARIVVWPENAARVADEDHGAYLRQASAAAEANNVHLLVADPTYLPDAPHGRDETHLFGPDGTELWDYEKARPVPGLEIHPPGDGRVPVIDTPPARATSSPGAYSPPPWPRRRFSPCARDAVPLRGFLPPPPRGRPGLARAGDGHGPDHDPNAVRR